MNYNITDQMIKDSINGMTEPPLSFVGNYVKSNSTPKYEPYANVQPHPADLVSALQQ